VCVGGGGEPSVVLTSGHHVILLISICLHLNRPCISHRRIAISSVQKRSWHLTIRFAGDTTCMLTRDIYRLSRAICLSVASFWTELSTCDSENNICQAVVFIYLKKKSMTMQLNLKEFENYLSSFDTNFWTVQDVFWVPWHEHSHYAVWVLLMNDVSRTSRFPSSFQLPPHQNLIVIGWRHIWRY
jgi:hypothetical protein